MRPWVHLLGVVGGAVAAVGITFWSTSTTGPRGEIAAAQLTRQTMEPKAVVEAFERMAFDEYRPADAVREYFSPDIVDHSQRIRGDFASIITLLERLDWSNGNGPRRTISNIVAEGDIVMVHYHLVREPRTPGYSAVDIFRVENGMIVEHWETLQELPAESPNVHGAF
jgi:predicted SnoaL-like aldol condensation-catalyzing enzyme